MRLCGGVRSARGARALLVRPAHAAHAASRRAARGGRRACGSLRLRWDPGARPPAPPEAAHWMTAAIVEADIERQRLDEEEDDADVIDLTAARNRQSDWEWDDAA